MKRFLALVVTAAMLASVTILPAAAAPRFPDAEGTWAESSIDRLGAIGLVQGDPDGSINPDRLMTRAEMATVLVRLLGLTAKARPATFTDVAEDDWFADAVLKCAAAGIMVGDGTGLANPNAKVTREEAIAMLSRALGVKGKSGNYLARFQDAGSVSTYAKGYMDALIAMGVLTGVGDGSNLAPQSAIDRASVLTLLDRLMVAYVTAPGEVTVEAPNGFVVIHVPRSGTVTVTGLTAGVVVATGDAAAVELKGLDTESTVVYAPVNVTIHRGARVGDLILNAATRVENNGTVSSVRKNHGKAVTVVGTAEEEPTVTATPTPTGSGSSGGGTAGVGSSGGSSSSSGGGGSSGPRPSTGSTAKSYGVEFDYRLNGNAYPRSVKPEDIVMKEDNVAGVVMGKTKEGATVSFAVAAVKGYTAEVTLLHEKQSSSAEAEACTHAELKRSEDSDVYSFTMPDHGVSVVINAVADGLEPSPSPSPTASPSPSPTASPSESPEPSPSASPGTEPSEEPDPTESPSVSPSPDPDPKPDPDPDEGPEPAPAAELTVRTADLGRYGVTAAVEDSALTYTVNKDVVVAAWEAPETRAVMDSNAMNHGERLYFCFTFKAPEGFSKEGGWTIDQSVDGGETWVENVTGDMNVWDINGTTVIGDWFSFADIKDGSMDFGTILGTTWDVQYRFLKGGVAQAISTLTVTRKVVVVVQGGGGSGAEEPPGTEGD